MEDEVLQLGGNIELSGFSSLEGGAMIVLKKIVGNYARKISDQSSNFERLSIHMKTVHDNQFEMHAKVVNNGKAINSSVTERNIFVAVDSALKKIMNEMSK
jgi:ribosome-associated translation inhibitor RaiA